FFFFFVGAVIGDEEKAKETVKAVHLLDRICLQMISLISKNFLTGLTMSPNIGRKSL
ncbi:unnamed protein product, partial [Musa acuminata var. zebrina]